MAPAKSARNGHDDSKLDTPAAKDKEYGNHAHSNGKMRRVASSAGANHRESAKDAAAAAAAAALTISSKAAQEPTPPGLQWPAFDRTVLHSYRRAYRLNTPSSFARDYHHWVLTQAGSIGLYSPTIARRKDLRRQSNDGLNNVVRKHFNGQGVQETDVIVEFLHKVRSRGVTKTRTARSKTGEHAIPPEQI